MKNDFIYLILFYHCHNIYGILFLRLNALEFRRIWTSYVWFHNVLI